MHIVVEQVGTPDGDRLALTSVTGGGEVVARREVAAGGLSAAVRAEPADVRWTWADTAVALPPLLAAGVHVARSHDLRLCHRILRDAAATASSSLARRPRDGWDEPAALAAPARQDALFDAAELGPAVERLDPVVELVAQLDAVRAAGDGAGRLRLLLAAESAGALAAAEMTYAGLPWRPDVHDALLADLLGPRPPEGFRPARLEALAAVLRRELDDLSLHPDSPGDVLRSLRRAGLPATSTRSWELTQIDHPAIPPLLEYKKLARLWTANGWHWLDSWVRGGRFRPVYVVGGVVTGRWASDGGGALQLPRQVRDAVRPDPGWCFVVADAAQLEPRILAAMSGDEAMAGAGRAADMYEGIVATGAVESRTHAKYGMLGAMYGGTQGVSGQVLPQLRRAFPAAIGLVERAAEVGERGGQVTTWLGRTSPRPDGAGGVPLGEGEERERPADAGAEAARARAFGRFTRNFVVQGTAAEWALCWLALLRERLHALRPEAPLVERPHLVFFLHDEVVVHAPADLADDVAQAVRESAAEAGRLLFPASPDDVEFALSVAVVDSYAEAKD